MRRHPHAIALSRRRGPPWQRHRRGKDAEHLAAFDFGGDRRDRKGFRPEAVRAPARKRRVADLLRSGSSWPRRDRFSPKRTNSIGLGSSKSAVGGELVLGCFEDLAPYFAPALHPRLFRTLSGSECRRSRRDVRDAWAAAGDAAIDLGLSYDLGLPSHFARILLHELQPACAVAGRPCPGGPTSRSAWRTSPPIR